MITSRAVNGTLISGQDQLDLPLPVVDLASISVVRCQPGQQETRHCLVDHRPQYARFIRGLVSGIVEARKYSKTQQLTGANSENSPPLYPLICARSTPRARLLMSRK
jgi:hypothetical protein